MLSWTALSLVLSQVEVYGSRIFERVMSNCFQCLLNRRDLLLLGFLGLFHTGNLAALLSRSRTASAHLLHDLVDITSEGLVASLVRNVIWVDVRPRRMQATVV